MRLSDLNQPQRAARLASSELAWARTIERRERDAELLARSLQLIAASCELLRRPVWGTPCKSADDADNPSAGMAGLGSAERKAGQ